jgi:hypothetical protein
MMTGTWAQRTLLALGACSLLAAAPLADRRDESRARTQSGSATAPNPDQTPDAVKALAVFFQSMATIETYLRAGELSGVHSEDSSLVVAVSVLSRETAAARADARDQLRLTLREFGRRLGDLHAAADSGDLPKVDEHLKEVLATYAALKSCYEEDVLAQARRLAERYTCPMHPDVRGRTTEQCPRCGMDLDQPVRIPLFYFGGTPALQTVNAAIRAGGPVQAGQPLDAILKLTTFGRPVLITDLRVVHTERIHLLVIDPSLTDYHHIHPRPTETPGEYAFSFTPRTAGPYRAWADVRTTATGFQEYVMADMGQGSTSAPADKTASLRAEVDGMRFELLPEAPLFRAGEPMRVRLQVSDASGKPFAGLEPVMGTFAHIVGFAEDYKTVLHTHPKTAGPLKPEQRGGPELEFQLYAERPGFYRFFAQVQVGGVSRFAPFGLQVAPAR